MLRLLYILLALLLATTFTLSNAASVKSSTHTTSGTPKNASLNNSTTTANVSSVTETVTAAAATSTIDCSSNICVSPIPCPSSCANTCIYPLGDACCPNIGPPECPTAGSSANPFSGNYSLWTTTSSASNATVTQAKSSDALEINGWSTSMLGIISATIILLVV